jgi:gamma-glutamyltranspeptidase/glutathione hydrolase
MEAKCIETYSVNLQQYKILFRMFSNSKVTCMKSFCPPYEISLSSIFFAITFLLFQSSFVHAQPVSVDPWHYQSIKKKICSKAVVVCAHPLAAQVGQSILQKGGNAFDAAIAAQWALAVVYPVAGNVGGGGFLVARLANNKTIALDYREKAPGAASKNMYVDAVTGKASTELSQNGHLSSGVPGTPAGLFAMHKYAKLPMKVLIQPAIDLAEKGYAISAAEARGLNGSKASFIKYNTVTPVFVKKEGSWKAGDTLLQKELAATLKRIRDRGAKGFYEGETAELIAAEMKRGHGIISVEDLKNFTVAERTPVEFNYRGYQVISMPPPSSGGIIIQQILTTLQDYTLAQYGFGSTKSIQLITEIERRSYADRAKHLGDPDYYKVPAKTIVSKEYLQQRMSDYDSTKASKSEDIKAGLVHESDETTHMSVLDAEGNAVAITTTLNNNYGSKTVVAGAGFLLNDEMDDFSIQEGVANMFGAIGGKANEIQPGKRMLSSMTPTIVLKNNKPFIVVGTPGGTTIITSVLQSIIDVIDFGMNADDAVNKPKFHHQWLPDRIEVENGFDTKVLEQLKAMGYNINAGRTIGRTEMILVQKDGKYEAVADHRGDDSVGGF